MNADHDRASRETGISLPDPDPVSDILFAVTDSGSGFRLEAVHSGRYSEQTVRRMMY